MLELKKEVDLLISDMLSLTNSINKINEMINSSSDESFKISCMKEFNSKYNNIRFRLLNSLKSYFIYEKENNIPLNFLYRKLYNKLIKV